MGKMRNVIGRENFEIRTALEEEGAPNCWRGGYQTYIMNMIRNEKTER
jgi:hypothetical protein